MTMQGVYNDGTKDVVRPVKVTSTGELVTASGSGSTGLTDAQLRASPVPIIATARTCLGTFRVTCTTSSQALAALIGTSIPVGATTCEIQADGGSIRLRRDGGTPTSTVGYRIDDGVEKMVDTALADVRLISASAVSVFANVIFFDRV